VGDPGIEPGVGLPGGVTVRCRTLQPVALVSIPRKGVNGCGITLPIGSVNRKNGIHAP